MRVFPVAAAIAAALLAGPVLAADAPVTVTSFKTVFVVEKDGRMTETQQIAFTVASEAAARQMSVQSIPYVEDQEKVELVEGRVAQVGGRTVVLSPDSARPAAENNDTPFPAFADRKTMQLLLPTLSVGDTVSLTWRKQVMQPIFPGQFAALVPFSPLIEWKSADVSVDAPADMTLTTEARGVTGDVSQKGGRRIYRWHFAAPAVQADPAVISALDRHPAVFVSSFADWPALGRAWGALALPKAEASEAVSKRAEAVVAGKTDPKEQARLIYDWVQKNLRVAPMALGQGAVEPASAETTLSRGYGDSKDLAMLTIALFKARGIAAEPVLVNDGTSYTLPKAPMVAALSHVIIFVPQWSVYADPAATGNPFAALRFLEYGKSALRIGAEAATLVRIPTLPDKVAGERTVTKMTLDATGHLTGETLNEATGPFAGELRRTAFNGVRMGPARLAALRLRAAGLQGTGAFKSADPFAGTFAFAVQGTFDVPRAKAWLEGDAFAMDPGLRLVFRPGDMLLGTLENRDLPAEVPTPCFSGRQEEDVSLTFPAGFKIGRMPKDVRIERPDFIYVSTWTLTDQTLRVLRVLETRMSAAVCEGAQRAEIAAVLPDLRRDMAARVWLEAK